MTTSIGVSTAGVVNKVGSVQIDIHKADHSLSQRYPLAAVRGVMKFMNDIHNLRQERLSGNIEASILLVDFYDAYRSAPLTLKERESIYYRFEKDYSVKDVAAYMNVATSTVLTLIKRGAYKISRKFRGTEGYAYVR